MDFNGGYNEDLMAINGEIEWWICGLKPSVPSRPLTPSPPFRRGGGAEITFDYLSFNGSLMDFNGEIKWGI